MKHNQTFFHGTCLNVMSYFLSKYITVTFKIVISQFYNWGEPKQRKWNMGHIQIWNYIFFYEKMLKNFNDFQNHILLIHDCSEPKQWKWNKFRHFSWDILKSDIIFHWSQNTISITLIIGIFQWDMWKVLKEVGYIKQWKIHEQELTSLQ